MTSQLLKKMFFVLLLALGPMLVSCDSNFADNSVAKAGTHHLQIRMHDFPIQDKEVQKVIVEVRKIEVHNSQSGWMTIAETARKYDLLELQNGITAVILDSPLPIGTYTQIRLELSQDNEVVVNGLSYPLKVPSGTETGIKLITPFDINEGKMVEVTLDFDAEKSVIAAGGDYHLKPVIKVEKIAEYDGAGLVTPEGGNVTTVDGVLNIQIPAGAVSQSIIVTAEKTDITGLPTPDASSQSVGIAYDLGPDGQTFNSDVLLSFHYNEEDFAGKGTEENLALYRYDETTATWIEIPSTVLVSADTVQAWVDHFSLYALFISPPVGIGGGYDIIGDSIAAGYPSYFSDGDGKRDTLHSGYLTYFIKKIAPNIVFTGNIENYLGFYMDAIVGQKSGDIRSRLEDPTTAHPIKDADNYILWVGTNDDYYVDPLNSYEQNMRAIINTLLTRPRPDGQDAPPTVYVCTILHRMDYFECNSTIVKRNEILKRIVQDFVALGEPVKVIDTGTEFGDFYKKYYLVFGDRAKQDLLADGLHPTVYSYGILGKYIAQNLN